MDPDDKWAVGDAYEPYVGRWSRRVAPELLAWLAPPPDRAWLDVGCGTGALTQSVLARCAPRRIVGIDRSRAFVAHARTATGDPRAAFCVGDAQGLPFADGAFGAAASALVLNFVPEPARMAAEMRRVVRRDGLVALYVWDYAGRMELMRHFWDAAVALDPAARDLDEGRRFPICRPDALVELLRAAGLSAVEARAIDVATVFRDFDDYWSPFLGGQGPAPGYNMSLSEERRAALRERIRAEVPIAADGRIELVARAWAVRGTNR